LASASVSKFFFVANFIEICCILHPPAPSKHVDDALAVLLSTASVSPLNGIPISVAFPDVCVVCHRKQVEAPSSAIFPAAYPEFLCCVSTVAVRLLRPVLTAEGNFVD
jgi:hypothetical protein